jgi:uncharacterized protein YegL
MGAPNFPGGAMARRPLHFVWILDCSGSMQGQKVQSLNAAIQQVIPQMRDAARSNPGVQVLMRAVTFSKGAQWHIVHPTPVEQFDWHDVSAEGPTDMGHALMLVADELRTPPMPESGLAPVLVLVTDGKPTDDFNAGLKALLGQRWGEKSVRIGIAIGGDADQHTLEKFIGNSELEVLDANDSGALVERIRWVSTTLLAATMGGKRGETKIPAPPPKPPAPADDSEVFTPQKK